MLPVQIFAMSGIRKRICHALQGAEAREVPSANEDSIQTNIDQLLQRIMQARMQQDPGAEDDAERDYRCNTSTCAL